jgi:hypothetical protein
LINLQSSSSGRGVGTTTRRRSKAEDRSNGAGMTTYLFGEILASTNLCYGKKRWSTTWLLTLALQAARSAVLTKRIEEAREGYAKLKATHDKALKSLRVRALHILKGFKDA